MQFKVGYIQQAILDVIQDWGVLTEDDILAEIKHVARGRTTGVRHYRDALSALVARNLVEIVSRAPDPPLYRLPA